jgi:aspartate aminotransferase
MQVSKMANTLIGSEIIKIGGEVNEMIKKGHTICNLTIGDFDPAIYPIPEELHKEIIEAYHNGLTNYPPANGEGILRNSVVTFLKNRGNLDYKADEILIAGGSRPLIYATYLALIDPGDKVIFPVPSWNNNHYCHLSGAKGIMVETQAENNFMPTAAELAPHLKGATMLALCSPLNPTGTAFTKKNLEEICDAVIAENKTRSKDQKPLYILFDQVYWVLTFGENKHYDPVSLRPELRDHVIYVDGISKAFAATGVRVGWAFGPLPVLDKMKSILGHVGAWAPKAEQVATAKYIVQNAAIDSFIEKYKTKLQKSLDTLYNGFQQLKKEGFAVDAIAPMGAIYLTVKVNITGKKTAEGKVLQNSMDTNSYLIEEAGLAMVPFKAFGASDNSNWFRLSVGAASLEAIENAIPRVKKALEKLQ